MAQLVEINQVGKREDLRDFISLIDMKEKPLLAMIPKLPDQKNMLVNWQADLYATPITAGVADGQDVDTYENAAVNRGLLQNYGQKFRRTAMVGDLAENVSNVAGAKAGELARSIDKKLEEISRDIEATLCSDNSGQAETSQSTPYNTRGLGIWFGTTYTNATDAAQVPSNFRTPSASVRTDPVATQNTAYIEDVHFRPLLKSIFGFYGRRENLIALLGTWHKAAITNFTGAQATYGVAAGTSTWAGVRAYTAGLDTEKVVNNIMFYEGDFNTVELHPSLLLNVLTTSAVNALPGDSSRMFVFPIEALGLTFNRAPRVMRLPDMGGGPRALVDAVCCLVCKNPLSGGQNRPTATRT